MEIDFSTDIRKLEEVSKSVSEKSKFITDLEQMTTIQQVHGAIHSAYVNLRRINQMIQSQG